MTLIQQLFTNILSILFLTVAILLRSVEESCLILVSLDLAAASHDFNTAATYQYFVYFVSNSCYTSKICGGELFNTGEFRSGCCQP